MEGYLSKQMTDDRSHELRQALLALFISGSLLSGRKPDFYQCE